MSTEPAIRFARRVFLTAAVYGVVVLLPQYFLEEATGRSHPPPIAHPEYFYGFIGVALAWQAVFYLVSRDPIRYRPIILPAVLEKAGFGVAAVWLYVDGRLSLDLLGAGLIDLVFGALFVTAWVRTRGHA